MVPWHINLLQGCVAARKLQTSIFVSNFPDKFGISKAETVNGQQKKSMSPNKLIPGNQINCDYEKIYGWQYPLSFCALPVLIWSLDQLVSAESNYLTSNVRPSVQTRRQYEWQSHDVASLQRGSNLRKLWLEDTYISNGNFYKLKKRNNGVSCGNFLYLSCIFGKTTILIDTLTLKWSPSPLASCYLSNRYIRTEF